MLAAAGVIVTVGAASNPGVASVIGLGVAAIAGAFAVWAFYPRTGLEISPQQLIDHGYLRTSELQTRVTLLATRADNHRTDEAELVTKADRLKAAFLGLLLATVIVFVGLIINASQGGHNGRQSNQRPSPTTASIKPTSNTRSSVRPNPHSQP